MQLYATVTSLNDPSPGWYKAEISINPGLIVSGTSLKGSAFTVGERVRIYQFLFWGGGAEFGFAKESEMDYSVAQFNPAFTDQVKAENPNGFLLNYIAQEASNKKQMFGAGKIHSFITVPGIGNIGARVDLVSSGTRAILGFTADLDPNQFSIGDGVLVSYWPNPGRAIVGWWQTAKSLELTVNFSGNHIYLKRGEDIIFTVDRGLPVENLLYVMAYAGNLEEPGEHVAVVAYSCDNPNPGTLRTASIFAVNILDTSINYWAGNRDEDISLINSFPMQISDDSIVLTSVPDPGKTSFTIITQRADINSFFTFSATRDGASVVLTDRLEYRGA